MTACTEAEYNKTSQLIAIAENEAACEFTGEVKELFYGSIEIAVATLCDDSECLEVIKYVAKIFPDCEHSGNTNVNFKANSEAAVEACASTAATSTSISSSASASSSGSRWDSASSSTKSASGSSAVTTGTGSASSSHLADTSNATAVQGGSNTGLIAGVVVGAIAALVVVAGLLIYWRRKMQHREKHDGGSTYSQSTRNTGESSKAVATPGYSLWEDERLASLKLDSDSIEDIGTIGCGAFAIVWFVRYRKTQFLASKRLRKEQATKQRVKHFMREIKLTATFEHRNIAQFVGAAWTIESDLQMLLEYLEGGDLREFLVNSSANPSGKNVWTHDKLRIARGIADALVYIHSFSPPVVHRDLKSRNVLLDSTKEAKLVDFGTSRYRSQDSTMTTGVGTGRWLAPEVISGEKGYGPAADIYSFGVLLSELDTHEIPYADARGANGHKLADVAILQMVAMNKLRPSFNGEACPAKLRAVAKRCLAQDARERPTAAEIAYEIRKVEKAFGGATSL